MARAGGALTRDLTRSGAPLRGALLVIGAASLWGSLGLFGRHAFRHGVSPLEVASVRAAIAFIGVLPILAAHALMAGSRTERPYRPAEVALLVAYGAFSIGLFYYLYMTAIERLPLAVAAALLYTAPAFVVAIAWGMRWEPVDLRRLLPLVMVLSGAALVTGVFHDVAGVTAAGAAFGVGSGVTYAVFTALGKRIRERRGTLVTTAWAYGAGAAVLTLVAPPWRVFATYPDAWPVLVLMGLLPTLVAALLFYVGIRSIDASAASMLTTIEPAVAAAIGFAWLGEALTGGTIAGTLLIIAAALLLARRPVLREPDTGRPV